LVVIRARGLPLDGLPGKKTKVVVLEEGVWVVDGKMEERGRGSGLTALGLFWVDAAFVLRSSLGSRDCFIGCLHDVAKSKRTSRATNTNPELAVSTCKQVRVKGQ
jgi:hypothetical protein